MAADMMTQLMTLVQGGMPPAQAIQYLRDAQAQQFAQMPLEQQTASNIGKYAGRVGQGLLRAAGVEDPMLVQASKMRELATQFDTSTAEGMLQYARALQSVNPAMAQQAATKAREMALTEAKIGSEKALTTQREREKEGVDPKQQFIRTIADKVTPQSLQTFSETGRYQDLQFLTKEEKGVKPPADFLTVAVELGFGEKNKIGDYTSKEVGEINKTLLERTERTNKAKAPSTKFEAVIPGLKGAPDVIGFRKTFNEVVKPFRDSINSADTTISLLDNAIAKNNFTSVAAARTNLAKAAGELQVSTADVKAYGTDPSLIGSIADFSNVLVSGTPTQDTLRKMREVARIIKRKGEARLKDEEQVARETAIESGIDKKVADKIFKLKPSGVDINTERANAQAAIASGAPESAVRARFKANTGQEL